MHPSICVISSSSPYDGEKSREAIEVALSSAACSINTSLLLIGKAVLQLGNLDGTKLGRKNISSLLASLPIYGIDIIHVDFNSLKEFRVKPNNIIDVELKLLKESDLKKFIDNHQMAITL